MLSLVCNKHNENLDFLCCENTCVWRNCCLLCKQSEHRAHYCIKISQVDALINRLKQSPTSNQPVELTSRIRRLDYTLEDQKKEMDKRIKEMMATFNNNLFIILKPMNAIKKLLEGKLSQYCLNFVANPHELHPIVQAVRLLSNPEIHNCQQLGSIIETVTNHLKQIISSGMTQMQNALTKLINQIDKININNWLNLDQKQKLARNRYQGLRMQQRENNLISGIHSERERQTDKKNVLKTEKDLEEDLISLLPLSTSASLVPLPSFNAIQEPKFSAEVDRLTRCVFDLKGKLITKENIFKKIKELKDNKTNKLQLKEFILGTPNEFDLSCLKRITRQFPNLTKLNYLFDFNEDGLKLQKEQVFLQHRPNLKFRQKSLPLSQRSFNYFGQLKQLQNIAIYEPSRFQKHNIKIHNTELKHITIGVYITKKKIITLPPFLTDFILSYSRLVTLNLFNIKTIDGVLLEKIFTKNSKTLTNFWLSECEVINGNFFNAIESSVIQSITFDQNKNISDLLKVPKTLKTLILENCQFKLKIPLKNLSKAINLTSFSIFESTFPSNQDIGSFFIEKMSLMPQCQLNYLNFGDCSSINNEALKTIGKMPNLRQLCLDYTNVSLTELVNQNWIKNLQKLAIVGLKPSKPSTGHNNKEVCKQTLNFKKLIEILLRKSDRLKSLSLKFDVDLTNIQNIYFKRQEHLNHIALQVSGDKQHKQLLKKFKDSMKELNKRVVWRQNENLSSSSSSDSSSSEQDSNSEK